MASITTIQGTDIIANSRATINTNFANLNTDKIETSVLDTDTTLAANSDAKIATQKATKAYADSIVGINASETVKGTVEEATQAEVTAGTDTGGTGAKLFVPPSKLNTQIAALSTSKKITVSTTEVTFTNGDGGAGAGVEQTLFSTTVPAGTLGTNNAIRFKIFIRNGNFNGTTDVWVFKLKYGGSTLVTTTMGTPSNAITNCHGFLEGYIIADGATNVQKATVDGMFSQYDGETTADAAVGYDKVHLGQIGTGAIDSTINQTLAVSLTQTNSANNDCVVEWFILEAIK